MNKVYRPSTGRLSYPFYIVNCKYYNNDGCHHMGTDYAQGMGAPIIAVLDGVVIEARTAPAQSHCGYGTRVILEHDAPLNMPPLSFIRKVYRKIVKREYFTLDKVRTTYAHLDSFCVNVGDTVKAGEKIGEMGDTGVGDTHLHLEVNMPTEPNQRYVETTNCGEANGFKIEGEPFLLQYYGETPGYIGVVIEPKGMVTRECGDISCQKTGNKIIAGASVSIMELQDDESGYTWGRLKNFENMPVEWVATSHGDYNYIELTKVEEPIDPPIELPADCEEIEKKAYQKGLEDSIKAIEALQG
jgi:murein DD-endopeptidase MepM/ murein hydrolase activator NlpD